MNPRLIWLGVAAFLLAVIAVFPAGWTAGLLPPQVQCGHWSGSVWRGQCRDLIIRQEGEPLQIQLLQWKLHPLSLLRLALKFDFDVRTPQGTVQGLADLRRGGRLAFQNLSADAVFDRRLATMLADGWNGELQARNLNVRMTGNTLEAFSGELELRDFKDARGASMGSYRLVFPPADAPPFTGTLTDSGGPLGVAATLTITAERRWQMDGLITPRPEASQQLRSSLQFLAAPDASGRHRIQSEGTFK